jgi:FkbM family methyltransferase
MLDDVRARAANPEHEWDRRALDWPLTKESTVVEVGGYCGRWALQIAERYGPRLFVFEPQIWAADVCRAVLADSATVLNYGLGDKDCVLPMGQWETDGCSFVNVTGPQANFGEIREIEDAFMELHIATPDLMLMNIEGYEYTLIPYMLSVGIRPKRLMVQCHGDMIDRIDGYRMLWTYGMVLTAWERA